MQACGGNCLGAGCGKCSGSAMQACSGTCLGAGCGKCSGVLVTHSLTGQKSPAFCNKPAKRGLDPEKVEDIILEVQKRFEVERRIIRGIITTKCADECKMMRKKCGSTSVD